MRLTLPRLLLVIAFLIVVLVELRTVLGFFDIAVPFTTVIVVGVVVIGALVLWSLLSSGERSNE
ncbi:CbaC protein [Natronorubrum aibiense]|uniref:CbaC protein n=1 Tax=Natronorubrum aibiense TaxID=348826 RepID=A0A5P9P0H3_9EURY|nr:CbaC protein [Natronorubrum aibiense]QFU81648.1 CbaC protein [Natronorubrum aibiense]